jgi:hypothetical protein
VLDLGLQPLADALVEPSAADRPDALYPLAVRSCSTCGLVQVQDLVDGASDALHAHAADSKTLRAHLAQWADEAKTLAGDADIVFDDQQLFHASDVDAAVCELTGRLPDGALLTAEFHHVLGIIAGGQFDVISHAHPCYLSLTAIGLALARHGVTVTSAAVGPIHGGSVRIYARRTDEGVAVDPSVAMIEGIEARAGLRDATTLDRVGAAAEEALAQLRSYLVSAVDDGRRVAGYGAPSRAATFLNAAGVDASLLAYTVDQAPGKQGRLLPGCRVPILAPPALLADRPDEVLILAWTLVDEIVEQLAEVRTWGGRFLVPLPAVTEVR